MDNTQNAWEFEYLREFEANTKNISGGESGAQLVSFSQTS